MLEGFFEVLEKVAMGDDVQCVRCGKAAGDPCCPISMEDPDCVAPLICESGWCSGTAPPPSLTPPPSTRGGLDQKCDQGACRWDEGLESWQFDGQCTCIDEEYYKYMMDLEMDLMAMHPKASAGEKTYGTGKSCPADISTIPGLDPETHLNLPGTPLATYRHIITYAHLHMSFPEIADPGSGNVDFTPAYATRVECVDPLKGTCVDKPGHKTTCERIAQYRAGAAVMAACDADMSKCPNDGQGNNMPYDAQWPIYDREMKQSILDACEAVGTCASPTLKPTPTQTPNPPPKAPTKGPTPKPPTKPPASDPTKGPTPKPPASDPTKGPTPKPPASDPTKGPSTSPQNGSPARSLMYSPIMIGAALFGLFLLLLALLK